MLNSEELINKVKSYNKFLNPVTLGKAYNFAIKAHENQKRQSGDPYAIHPIAVANILSDLKLDSATIATGLLHDTIEDTYATYETIKNEFGQEVADLVDGVTKISAFENQAIIHSKAENFRKLILATSKDIRVYKNQTTNIGTIEIIEKSEELGEVVLEGYKKNKFYRSESTIVSKLPLKDIENPQVYNTVSSKLLNEQVITNFEDALKNAPGIYKLWESTGRGGDGGGYYSLRGFAVQPTMMNGLPSLTNGTMDPANIENVEIIKGPSGTLYGSSLISYGGLINVNTKRPHFDGFGGSISYTGGSYGLNRVNADINTLLNEEETVALRINTAYHTQNSFRMQA